MATKVTVPTTAGTNGTICDGPNHVFAITATRLDSDSPSSLRWLFLFDGATQITPGGIPLPVGDAIIYPFGGGGYVCTTDVNFKLSTTSQSYGTLGGTAQCNAQVSDAPYVTSISPDTGSTNGGDEITITGVNFTGAFLVQFGGNSATEVTVVSDTEITCRTPGHSDGIVDVTVKTQLGLATLESAFTYDGFNVANLNLTMFMEGDNLTASALVGSTSANPQSSDADFFLESTGSDLIQASPTTFGGHDAVWWIKDDTWTSPEGKTLGDYVADDSFTAVVIFSINSMSTDGSHYYDFRRILGQGGGGTSWGIGIGDSQIGLGIKTSGTYKEIFLPAPDVGEKCILQFRLKDGVLSARKGGGAAWTNFGGDPPATVGTLEEMGYFLTSFSVNDKADVNVALLLITKDALTTETLDYFCIWAEAEYGF